MITVSQLKAAQPALWADAITGWNALLNLTRRTAHDIRDQGAGPTRDNWQDALGQKAAGTMSDLANQFDNVSYAISGITMILQGLADAVGMAQSTLTEALHKSVGLGLDVADNGHVQVVESGLPGAAGDAALPVVQAMVQEALNAATNADHEAAVELGKLGALATTVEGDPLLAEQTAASQTELSMFASIIPGNATPDQVNAWWSSLSPQQQTELENAVPTQIYGLNGIPQSVKDQLRGSGNVNKMHLVQFADDHWNDESLDWQSWLTPWKPMDNCTHFVSTALENAGMQQSDAWHDGVFQGVVGELDADTASPTWGGAQNLHDLLTSHGGQVVPLGQAKPGDIVFFQDDPSGHIHHSAVVTAVLPNGDIRYTQHSDPALDQSWDGRSQQAVDVGGPQHPVVVRLAPNGY